MSDDEPTSAITERMNGAHTPLGNGDEPRSARTPPEPFGGAEDDDEDRLATLMHKSRKDEEGDELAPKTATAHGSSTHPGLDKPLGNGTNGNRKRRRSNSPPNGRRKAPFEADTWISPDVRARGKSRRTPPPRRGRGAPEEMFDSWVAERDRYRGWERDPRTNYWMPPPRDRDDTRDYGRRRDPYDDDYDDRRGGPRRRRPSPPPFERSRGRRGSGRSSVDEIRAEPMSVVSEKLLARAR